ncbi:TMM44 protein, partial [Polypterus senegalus]
MSGKVERALPAWTTEYLQRCFANEKVCVSFALWIAAAVLWIVADSLLLFQLLRTKGKHYSISVHCIVYGFIGNLSNTVGALLANQLTIQENTDVIGYALGLVALTISWTSKCPDIQKMYNGKKFSYTQVWSQIFKILASVIYASAILCHDKQTDYILKALPWILNSLGTAAIDNTILLLNYLRVTKVAHHIGLDQVLAEEQDTQVLLSPVYQDMEEIEEEIQLEATGKTWDFEDMDQNWNKGLNTDPEDVNKGASIHQDLVREPQTDTASHAISDFWYYEGRVMMTDERASAILADYEEEIRRTGK